MPERAEHGLLMTSVQICIQLLIDNLGAEINRGVVVVEV